MQLAGDENTDLVCNEEESTIDQDSPDCNVGNDACCQAMGIHSDGTIPVQSNKCPRKGSRCGWDVDESRVGAVAEVEGGQVEEVDDQDDLSPDEVGTNE